MVLPSTGQISASNIKDEFTTLSTPMRMSSWYLLPNTGNSTLPLVGAPIAFSHMYGRSFLRYAFDAFVFTNAGATGRTGPTSVQIPAAYSAASWAATNVSIGAIQGIQIWNVPRTATYMFYVAGASGRQTTWGSAAGNVIFGEVPLQASDVLRIVVGQMGEQSAGTNPGFGGGGGTFVFKNSVTFTNLLFASGGGGGPSNKGAEIPTAGSTGYGPGASGGSAPGNGDPGFGGAVLLSYPAGSQGGSDGSGGACSSTIALN